MQRLPDGCLQLTGFETPRARFGSVDDPAIQANQVQAGGKSGVCLVDGVVDAIHQGGDPIIERVGTALSCCLAFIKSSWVINVHGRFRSFPPEQPANKIIPKPPSIYRVGFLDIDDEKLHLLVIGFIQVTETHRPVCEGRSGVAAKYQRDGLFAAVIR